jgi:hypothetical protein
MPSQLVSAAAPSINVSIASAATYGASRKKLIATHFCARRSASDEIVRVPVKRQMTMTLARPSIPLSRPKATSAIDPAKMPATTPTAPSIPNQISVSAAKNLARRARRSHDELPGVTSTSATIRQEFPARARLSIPHAATSLPSRTTPAHAPPCFTPRRRDFFQNRGYVTFDARLRPRKTQHLDAWRSPPLGGFRPKLVAANRSAPEAE